MIWFADEEVVPSQHIYEDISTFTVRVDDLRRWKMERRSSPLPRVSPDGTRGSSHSNQPHVFHAVTHVSTQLLPSFFRRGAPIPHPPPPTSSVLLDSLTPLWLTSLPFRGRFSAAWEVGWSHGGAGWRERWCDGDGGVVMVQGAE
ncbi:hypothetical protein JZ751_013147, partial [Albula glossodonta]